MDGLEQLVTEEVPEEGSPAVRLVSVARLPTRHGDFRVAAFWDSRSDKEHLALIRGDVVGAQDLVTRLHSECLTGDALGSLRCDCRDQLDAALGLVGARSSGLVLYLRQEGRGIGLLNKIKAYSLQDQGLDTVDANLALGFPDDARDYQVAAEMLSLLQVASIRLLTNNPDKVQQLEAHGVQINERVPHTLPPNRHNLDYLRTKADKSGHLIDLSDAGAVERPQRRAGK